MNKIFLVVAMMAVSLALSAKRVDLSEAQGIAERFASGASPARSDNAATLAYEDENYYVFNYARGGFVIISSSDLTDEVLGYSRSGVFVKSDIPANMETFLQNYSTEISYAEKHNLQARSAKSRGDEAKRDIEPLIKSQWNQYHPYNAYCPESNGQKTLSGCVATAMAQIVAYHKCGSHPTGSYSYSNLSIDLDTCAIHYVNLCAQYPGDETLAQQHEVAKLMKMCGLSINTTYGVERSSSNTFRIIAALTNSFDYNADDAKWCVHYTYESQDAWEDEIYNSLKNSNPVPYQAWSREPEAGHAFICDGYEDGYFHMNWGWGGYCDGYFKLNALQAAGFNYSYEGYETSKSEGHCAITNLHPNVLNEEKDEEYLMPNISYTLSPATLEIEYLNKGLYDGNLTYGFLMVNEHNDTTALTPKQSFLERGSSTSESITIHDLKLSPGVTTIIPVVYRNDGVKRIIESNIQAVVGANSQYFTETKNNSSITGVSVGDFVVTKASGLTIRIEGIDSTWPVVIYNLAGQEVYQGVAVEVTLPAQGIYFVKNGPSVRRIVV